MESLEGCAQVTLDPGDAIIIKTPTGGGFGDAGTNRKGAGLLPRPLTRCLSTTTQLGPMRLPASDRYRARP